jgi:hypothetical protein
VRRSAALGEPGTGKTTLMVNMILQDVAAGRGVAVFDPSAKGDFIRDLLGRLPADVGDRLVIVDPDTTALPALNLLDPATTPDGSPHPFPQLVGVLLRGCHDDFLPRFTRSNLVWKSPANRGRLTF